MEESEAAAAQPARWTCEACGCRTNTEADDATSCGVCGTRRVNSIRRGLLASSLGMGLGYPSRENDDEEDMDDSDGEGDGEGEGEDDDDGEEHLHDDGGIGDDDYANHLSRLRQQSNQHQNNQSNNDRERERAERAALRRRQNQVSDILGLAGSNIGERFGLALAAGGGGIPVALAAAGGLGGLHHHHSIVGGAGGANARRSLDSSGSLIPLRSDVNSDLILRQAQENSSHFQPQWSASHCGRSVMVDNDKGLVACLTENGEAGRCVRTQDPIPGAARNDEAQAQAQDPPVPDNHNQCHGWKIMFEHATREKGRSMGGCYLLGVTTERFDNFTARNGLQQSKLFWGIEDGGRRYEGSGNASGNTDNDNDNEAGENQDVNAEDGDQAAQAQAAASNANAASMIQLNRAEAPRNSENVLFGSKEVITVVADMTSSAPNEGKLHFWRDGRFIGTLVSNLPTDVPLYPVAVPFNSGVCVTITGLSDTSPAVAMLEYKRRQKTLAEEQNTARKEALKRRREMLLDTRSSASANGTATCLSLEVKEVLLTIWTWYCEGENGEALSPSAQPHPIRLTAARRLWYRCGIKLSHLEDLVLAKTITGKMDIEFQDFVDVVSNIVKEEQEAHSIQEDVMAMRAASRGASASSAAGLMFEPGDKVELCDAFDRYGDAYSGPLRPGDVGTVVEMQRGSGGSHSHSHPHSHSSSNRSSEDRQSVRVLFNGRRWWYQPQALVGERSGLVEPPAIKFLVQLLRAHGYESDLCALWGTPVTSDSWKVGDLVMVGNSGSRTRSKRCKTRSKTDATAVALPRKDADPMSTVGVIGECASSRRDSGLVSVSFANAPTKRIKVESLVYTTWHHGPQVKSDEGKIASTATQEDLDEAPLVVNADAKKKLNSIRNLNKAAILSLIHKDTKSNHTLSRLVSSGLPDAILDGIQSAMVENGKGDVAAISTLGSLCVAVSKQLLLTSNTHSSEGDVESGDAAEAEETTDPSDEIVAESMEVDEEQGQSLVPAGAGDRASLAGAAGSSARLLASRRGVNIGGRRGQALPSNVNAIDVRELVRDLGISSDQRRGVLLALMASERMHLDPRTLGRLAAAGAVGGGAGGLDDGSDRNARNHNVFPFSRFSAEAALGLASGGGDEQDDLFASARLSRSSSRPGDGSSATSGSNLLRSKIIQQDSSSSSASTRGRRQLSTATKSLIANGLLLNSPAWTKQALANGADPKGQDLEGGSILKLALQFGCSLEVLTALVDAGGCPIALGELKEAAASGQAKSLELLLWNTSFPKKSFWSSPAVSSLYSKKVMVVIHAAQERQEQQCQAMHDASVTICAQLLTKFIAMTLYFCRQGQAQSSPSAGNAVAKKWRAGMDVMVGDVLLQAVHDCQTNALAKDSTVTSSSSPVGHDGRIPAFGAGPSSRSTSNASSSSNHNASGSVVPNSSLLHVMSDEVLSCALRDPSTMDTYFRLTELFLWSKEIKNSAIGLLLASKVIHLYGDSNDFLRGPLQRFGVQPMCLAHEQFAKDQLRSIKSGLDTAVSDNADSTRATDQDKDDASPVIRCPKQHTTIIHLTKHSSFRCDFCGKGVPQGQPMHGCRACDWDACEACTDLAEGGLVKWTYISDLAGKCLEGLKGVDENENEEYTLATPASSGDNNNTHKVEQVAKGIRRCDAQAAHELKDLLKSDHGVTLYEFNSCILPAMYAALVETNTNDNRSRHRHSHGGRDEDEMASYSTTTTPTRRRKKQQQVNTKKSPVESLKTRSSWSSFRQAKKPRMDGNFKTCSSDDNIASSSVASCSSSPFQSSLSIQQRSNHAFMAALVSLLSPTTEGGTSSSGSADAMATPTNEDDGVEDPNHAAANDDIEEEEEDDGAVEEEDDDELEDEDEDHSKKDVDADSKKKHASNSGKAPLLRMLHTSLSFHEHLRVSKHAAGDVGSELHSLLAPFDVSLYPTATTSDDQCQEHHALTRSQKQKKKEASEDPNKPKLLMRGEPLMTIEDLQRHVLRCGSSTPTTPGTGSIPSSLPLEYVDYCRQLADDRAIIVEPSNKATQSSSSSRGGSNNRPKAWRLARVVGYDANTGAHLVKYATQSSTRILSEVNFATTKQMADHLVFQGRKATLILALRDVCVLHRDRGTNAASSTWAGKQDTQDTQDEATDTDLLWNQYQRARPTPGSREQRAPLAPGTRAESELRSPDGHNAYTIISSKQTSGLTMSFSGTGAASDDSESELLLSSEIQSSHSSSSSPASVISYTYTVVSDSGEVLERVPEHSLRRHAIELRSPSSVRNAAGKGAVLKRRWSALGLASNMHPLQLEGSQGGAIVSSTSEDQYSDNSNSQSRRRLRSRTMSIDGEDGEETVELSLDMSVLERPPSCILQLSAVPIHSDADTYGDVEREGCASAPAAFAKPNRVTLYSALQQLASLANVSPKKLINKRHLSLYYSWTVQWPSPQQRGAPVKYPSFSLATDANALLDPATSSGGANQDGAECDGLDHKATQCLQLINRFAECVAEVQDALPVESKEDTEKDSAQAQAEAIRLLDLSTLFISPNMTSKLTEQLDDSLTVVGGALPQWAYVAPALAPLVFSHTSRRLLLDRAAFGVSRSAMRQQDSKIAVAPLRQRMAALRARAVELVGEAFSGGAADPTALQLQADELYAMEEALASRVNAAFRAQRWEERHLECAKAAIRRNHLLKDASAIMETYATTPAVNRRRLEVRFTGESGFDAASGEEAGVTRGFYADVAEALLDCAHVAGVACSPCADDDSMMMKRKVKMAMAMDMTDASDDLEHMTLFEERHHDATAVTGHQESMTTLLPLWIPDVDASSKTVIPTPRAQKSSGIGVFPRPLEAGHPQHGAVLREFRFIGRLFAAALRDKFLFPLPLSASFLKLVQSIARTEERSTMGHGKITGSPPSKGKSPQQLQRQNSFKPNDKLFLSSGDLPRPGFLGGEIYAVEQYICAALDSLEQDSATSHLSEDEMFSKREEISKDVMFARKALGKNYDCSFEDYVEGRTFVDPLDPSQDHCAYELCGHGASRPVTIHNVREWVVLAKQFVLHDGVIAQAEAFCRGVNDFFSADALLLLTPTELHHDVCGGGDNVDSWTEEDIRALLKLDGGKGAAEALVAVAAIGGEGGAALSRRFGPSSPTIGYLVRALKEATPTARRQFLSFVTSVPIVTPGPMEVVPIVSPGGEFLSVSEACMPRANTCARRLYLPRFDSFAHFQKVFYAVLREESQFKGFYEWRG